jgi:ankyrin repeat protein
MLTDALWYELRNSVYTRQLKHAEDLLNANPSLFDLRNSIGETVLHFLAVENDIQGVEWLHDRGFSLDTKNRFGEPLVFEAADFGHKELVLWLAHHGADFSVVDRKNRNIGEYLLGRACRDEEHRRRREEMVQFLMQNVSGARESREPGP